MTGFFDPVNEDVQTDAVIMRVQYVVGADAVRCLGTQRRYCFGNEVDRQTVKMRALPMTVAVQLVKRAGRTSSAARCPRAGRSA